MRLPSVSESERASGKPIPVYGELVKAVAPAAEPVDENVEAVSAPILETESPAELAALQGDKQENPRNREREEAPLHPDVDEFGPQREASTVDHEAIEAISRLLEPESQTPQDDSFESSDSSETDAAEAWAFREKGANRDSDLEMPVVFDRDEPQEEMPGEIQIEMEGGDENHETYEKDRRFLSKFFGFCFVVLGITIAAPAIYACILWQQNGAVDLIPRWVYLLIFVGSLHLVYSIFLFQLPDWSSLWAVAVVLLSLSSIYAIFCAAIWLGDGESVVIRFLQLPTVVQNQGAIWCALMVTLSCLVSYLCGREAINWHRTQRWLTEVYHLD